MQAPNSPQVTPKLITHVSTERRWQLRKEIGQLNQRIALATSYIRVEHSFKREQGQKKSNN